MIKFVGATAKALGLVMFSGYDGNTSRFGVVCPSIIFVNSSGVAHCQPFICWVSVDLHSKTAPSHSFSNRLTRTRANALIHRRKGLASVIVPSSVASTALALKTESWLNYLLMPSAYTTAYCWSYPVFPVFHQELSGFKKAHLTSKPQNLVQRPGSYK